MSCSRSSKAPPEPEPRSTVAMPTGEYPESVHPQPTPESYPPPVKAVKPDCVADAPPLKSTLPDECSVSALTATGVINMDKMRRVIMNRERNFIMDYSLWLWWKLRWIRWWL